MRTQLLSGFFLDDVLIEPLKGLVTSEGTFRHLPPKAVEVLVQLAMYPGSLVTREELLEVVWGHDGSQDSLSHAVSDLRNALCDQRNDPCFIQTIPKRGYRLLVKPRLSGAPHNNGSNDTVTRLIDVPPLFQELMRRKVVQTSMVYLLVGWLLIQIADTAFDNLGMPWWSAPFVTILVVAGFPIALLLSWFLEFAGGKLRLDKVGASVLRKRSGITFLAVIGALVVSTGGLSTYRLLSKDSTLFGTPPVVAELEQNVVTAALDLPVYPNSVAVLRFLNLGGDNKFSDGLSESLLHLLTRISELSIPSRTSAWAIADDGLSSTDIAKRLRVRYVLEGSVQQVAKNIRVSTQLIDGYSGNQLWSENYDRELNADEFFFILDNIARQVVNGVQTTISTASLAVLDRKKTSSTEALGFYLLGKQYLREPKSDESLTNAVLAFEGAVGEDAHYAEAYAGLCDGYLAWYVMTRDTQYFEKAERPCLRALTLDDSLAEVYAAMGSLHRYAGRSDEAQIELEKARELIPHSAPVLEELGRVYRAQDKLALAEKTFTEAIVAEPSSWSVYKSLGNFLFRTGRYEEALPLYQQVIKLVPEKSPGYNNLGSTYFMLGQFKDATLAWDHIIEDSPTRSTYINYANSLYYQFEFRRSAQMLERALQVANDDYRVWENLAASLRQVEGAKARENEAYQQVIELAGKTLQINPGDRDALISIALTFARTGDDERALEYVSRLIELGWDDPNVSFFMALVRFELDDPQGALQELEQAVGMGFPVNLIAADPDFYALRETPRFAALIKRD